jgi:phenylalanyl-tRNA synthetase beta chain
MKISYKQLSKYIDHGLSVEELGEAFTRAGLEVEEITHFSLAPKGLEGLVIGQVKNVIQHPNADRLRCTLVDVGTGELLKIVCGAPNVEQGQKVVVATVGTTLHPIGGDAFTIKKSKIRGEDSEGMICAEDEIGTGKSHDGIIVLKEDAKVGQPYKEYLNLYEDDVLELSITPNRVDAASHIGAARDIAALLEKTINYPEVSELTGNAIPAELDIKITDPEACPRYSGIIIKGIEVKDSPQWLQNSLRAIGLQPINNVVDVTNFVLHELGHPLHAFDLSQIRGNKIIIQNAAKDSSFTTLDKQSRKLDGSELMICNEEDPMAMAGVFGGLESGISGNTNDIFIESAYFNPSSIRRTSRNHQLYTDASFRFERGADPNVTIYAMMRAASLIKEVAGGDIINHVYDEYPKPILPRRLRFDFGYLEKIAGIKIDAGDIKKILASLEIKILSEDKTGLQLEIPTFKIDVLRPIDVVEEVLRIYSFDKIPVSTSVKSILQVDKLGPKEQLKKKLSSILIAKGFCEAYHLSFVNAKENISADAVGVLNPISIGLEYVRDNMLKPGLKSILHNLNRQQPDVKLFEWGHTYHTSAEAFYQGSSLSIWISGSQLPESWYEKSGRQADFYFLKGIASQLLSASGIKNINTRESDNDAYEFSMDFFGGSNRLMTAGKVNSLILKRADITKPVFYAEIDMEALLAEIIAKDTHYNAISKFPGVERDLSLVVPNGLKYEQIREKIVSYGTSILNNITIFDVYEGEQVEKGYKSYSISLAFEDKKETLEDKKVEKIIQRILGALEKDLGVKIR